MLFLIFLTILLAFSAMMIGISLSATVLTNTAFLVLLGALLYTPVKNRIFGKWIRKPSV